MELNQSPVESFDSQPKSHWLVITFSVVVIILFTGILFLYLQNQKLQKKVIDQQITSNIQDQSSQTPKTVSTTSTPPDETAGWKTYTNENYGFQVKYPNNPFVRLICPNEHLLLIQRDLQTKDVVDMGTSTCARDGRYDFEIIISDQRTQEPTSDEYFTVTKSLTTISGISAQKYKSVANKTEGFSGAGSQHNEVMFQKNNYYYHIFASLYTEPYFNQILSTFKFTN